MNATCKISVIVPVYGVERYIERCARSLFEQTYENLEIIFVNDATKDRSMEILSHVIGLYPNREPQITIINHEKNLKLGNARNTGVKAATGDFIIHVDSDDYIDTDLIENCVCRQQATGADIIYFDGIKYTQNSTEVLYRTDYTTPNELLVNTLSRKIPVSIWGLMIRRTLYTENDIRVEGGINNSEDYIVTPRLIYAAKKIAKIENTFYHYDCTNAGSITASNNLTLIRDNLFALDYLENFFADKDSGVRQACIEGSIHLNIANICACAFLNDESLFNNLKQRLSRAASVAGVVFPPKFKKILHMNLRTARLYIKLGLGIKASYYNVRRLLFLN